MKWEGHKINNMAKDRKLSLQKLADKIGVSRQTVNDWIKGQIPKGSHLLMLSRILAVNPNEFFENDIDNYILMPSHRKRKTAKVTEATQEASIELAKEYLNIFKNHKNSEVVPVIRTRQRDLLNAQKVADKLRAMADISKDKPMDYGNTFRLIDVLGINAIFRSFPEALKSYAFYTKICEHRVVFVNYSTNILDLIFPLLHESVHAVMDEPSRNNEDEENFCDLVANFLQFPDSYVQMVYDAIKQSNNATKVNVLKSFASSNGHSLYGIVKAIKYIAPDFDLNIHGADSNLKKAFPTIQQLVFIDNEVRTFVYNLMSLNINFFKVISNQIDSISNRKLAELFELESVLDAKDFKAELLKESSRLNEDSM